MSEIEQPEERIVQVSEAPTQPVTKPTDQFEHKAAGFWIRFWAYVADLLVLASIGMLLIKPIFRLLSLEINDPTWYAPFTLITSIIFYAYFVLMTKFFNQTVGKMIFGIKVITKDREKLKWSTVLFREWVGRIISVIPLNIPYLAVAFTPKKQAIHDFIADTLVVHEAVYDKTQKVEYTCPPAAKELQEQNIF
ncbi:RDD family protein [Bacillus sp. Cr_A10]|uniref:RDD family protein n=1 Tax=Bacillus sp. Cr_A10 TaxID=3033993 RepID=UPI0023DC5B46|nr:RDD family protein [Bacillus sp. Cr_A10]MDF2067885.1 RDD family protein [Bacillus sp. Cr_A10]